MTVTPKTTDQCQSGARRSRRQTVTVICGHSADHFCVLTLPVTVAHVQRSTRHMNIKVYQSVVISLASISEVNKVFFWGGGLIMNTVKNLGGNVILFQTRGMKSCMMKSYRYVSGSRNFSFGDLERLTCRQSPLSAELPQSAS